MCQEKTLGGNKHVYDLDGSDDFVSAYWPPIREILCIKYFYMSIVPQQIGLKISI